MVEVKVCIGTSCHLHGSYNVMMSFKQLIEEYNLHDKINLAGRFCTGCDTIPALLFEKRSVKARYTAPNHPW